MTATLRCLCRRCGGGVTFLTPSGWTAAHQEVHQVTRSVTLDVRGIPRPQGSMKMHRMPNGAEVTRYSNEDVLWGWRRQLTEAMRPLTGGEPFTDGVEALIGFEMVRPKGHFGTGRNMSVVRLSAPRHPIGRPDIDKLVRAILDSAKDAGIYRDDSQVVSLRAAKRYATGVPGVRVTFQEVVETW